MRNRLPFGTEPLIPGLIYGAMRNPMTGEGRDATGRPAPTEVVAIVRARHLPPAQTEACVCVCVCEFVCVLIL